MQYRPEVDGLRAIAVGSVLLFHAEVPGFTGGFIGVDIFFVISGFLITAILIEDLRQGQFSIMDFYDRRARRILPALFTVILVTALVARELMLPWQYEEFSGSALSAVFFVSNFFFWRTSGYFDVGVDEKPLLHTWSLAVEEQYYLIFPIFLYFVLPRGRRLTMVLLIGVVALSLAVSEWGWRNYPQANFFVTPTRVWEILLGAICAFISAPRVARPVADILTLAGLVAVVWSFLWFNPRTPIPSITIAPALLGTATILLFARGKVLVARLLALPPFVALGLISYSLYLWHQPVLALYRVRFGHLDDTFVIVGLLMFSVGLAVASYYLIERPFRKKGTSGHQIRPRIMIGTLGAGFLAIIVISGFSIFEIQNGRYRFAEIPNDKAMINVRTERKRSWELYVLNASLEEELSRFSSTDEGKVRVLIVGDSHAKDLFNALQSNADLFPEFEFRVAFFSDGCMTPQSTREATRTCLDAFRREHADLTKEAEVILFSMHWAGRGEDGLADLLHAAVRYFQEQDVTIAIASGAPTFSPSGPHLIARLFHANRIGPDTAGRLFFDNRSGYSAKINGIVKRVATELGATFLEKIIYACDEIAMTCEAITPGGHAVFADSNHLTIEGAKHIGIRIRKIGWLKPLLAQAVQKSR